MKNFKIFLFEKFNQIFAKFGYSLIKNSDRFSRGVDLCFDIRSFLPNSEIKCIFDVGANLGQSASYFKEFFPDSSIYCFEPVKHTFQHLTKKLNHYSHIYFINSAVGAENSNVFIEINQKSDLCKIVSNLDRTAVSNTEFAVQTTLDSFSQAHNIDNIDFLKIDTEGSDYNVLMGSQSLLSSHRIQIIQVEVSMNSTNHLHASIDKIRFFLERYNYFLFGIYEQVNEFYVGSPILRRSNAVFISKKCADLNSFYR
ncbi:methyltransferase, FkbM family [Cyclobacterium lianum]|uniref:Methyltransferase, FkbM family n=1 Tax=Cyclobacterium lianum TaxID=388280 RepID=A0A1M7QKD8_9BACT|nr:FkbM family methyltransferase [Cyclobacterium lianum]SHN31777.1 methyltransferase, FkbM family [Cyclobacterium lianum]